MLGTVRVARGLTQSELARHAGLSQALLSKVEGGLVTLDEGRLASLADQLDVPEKLLVMSVAQAGPSTYVFHRKRSTLTVSKANQLRADLDLLHLQVAGIVGDFRPPTIPKIPLPVDGYTSPEEVAEMVRAALGYTHGPAFNLVSALESAGVAVLRRPLGSVRIDAMVSWPPGRRPIVLLGDHAPGDRQRFTVAHELGHAVMHDIPTETQETEADRFAAELLMPRVEVSPLLDRLTVPRLAQLKSEWGVSMAALLRRARDLDKISDFRYRSMNIELSRAGYRTREPVDVRVDEPRLVMSIVEERLASGETIESLANSAWMTSSEFRRVYLEEAPG